MHRPVLSAITSADTQHGAVSTNLPSPTLTNPDLILPDYGERETSTPSPPFHHRQSPLSLDANAFHDISTRAHVGMNESGADIGLSTSLPMRPKKKLSPPRRWVYEGHEVGPPLSDIGEEDSPPLSRWQTSDDEGEVNSSTLENCTTISDQWGKDNFDTDDNQGTCDEESCSSSSSTVSCANSGDSECWEGFDGHFLGRTHKINADTDETNSQDAEHNEENDDFDIASLRSDTEGRSITAMSEEEEDTNEEISSAMLSNEVERILENAKKRLTHMEGNLSRARSSFRMTPSPVTGSFALGSHQPVRRRAHTSLAGALLRQRISQDMSANSLHSRGSSDTTIPTSQKNVLPAEGKQPFRSLSALGSTNSSGFGASDHSPRREHFEPDVSRWTSTSPSQSSPVRSRTIGEIPQNSADTNKPLPPVPPIHPESNTNDKPKISSMEEFNLAYPSSPPSRSHSQLQVRDFQDQMKDLQNKISNLRVQAREDIQRRRSFQGLQTSSQFATVAHCDAGAFELGRGTPSDTEDKAIPVEGENGFENGGDSDVVITVDSSPSSQTERPISGESAVSSGKRSAPEETYGTLVDPLVDPSPHEEADDEDIDRAALAEILNEPLDSPVSSGSRSSSSLSGEVLLEEFPEMAPGPEPVRHEDRVDAFDYQNFFLHSALGNVFGTSRASYVSTGSIETTRAGSHSGAYMSPRTDKFHGRTNSGDSISTAATFATATEGINSSDDEYPGDEIDEALFWSGNKSLSPRSYEHPRSPTSRSTGTMSAPSTPRASLGEDSYVRDKDSKSPPAPGRHTASKSPGSPSSLISSLVSSLVASYVPESPAHRGASASLGKDDATLLEALFQSLGRVCSELQISSTSNVDSNIDEKSPDLLRRRLDAARKVLEGQVDI